MSIWAQTLVKNEARWLWYSVTSVIDHVEKILLWDTGSTDGTIKIIEELRKKYPGKVDFRQYDKVTSETFTKVRQEMLDATKSDWFIVLDGDEIWYEDSIKKVIETINKEGEGFESIIVPTINLVGDIFHYQEDSAGRYKFGARVGHFNLRGVNRNISGLHSQGVHGVWGWADGEGKMIQERDPAKIRNVDAPYLHATHLQRAGSGKDPDVIKRKMKLKYEIGNSFPKDFYYPEVFFRPRPATVESPWKVMNSKFKLVSYLETPLRKIKRKVWQGKAGY
jgi:glycosyltransferase involved in cell wall biosynthesis